MSQERLEDIKNRYMELEYDFNLRKEDIDWLIEQAERVQELEEVLLQNKYDNALYDKRVIDLLELKEENKRYCETLEFYANRENYKPKHYDPNSDNGYMSTIDYDEGEKARQTLAGVEN